MIKGIGRAAILDWPKATISIVLIRSPLLAERLIFCPSKIFLLIFNILNPKKTNMDKKMEINTIELIILDVQLHYKGNKTDEILNSGLSLSFVS